MPSRFAPRNRLAAVRKKKNSDVDSMTVIPSSSNDFLKAELLEEEGWKQSRVLRCSYRVLQLIGNATLTEKVIRENLGNNPDTSKALRLLLKRKMIKRVGYGGRSCPFHYQSLSAGDKMETSSGENSDEPVEPSNLLELEPVKRVVKKRSNGNASSSAITMRKEPCDANGMEPHEVLVTVPVRSKFPRALKEARRGPSMVTKVMKPALPALPPPPAAAAAGSTPSAAALAAAAAARAAAGVIEPEIPVPGWRVLD